MIPLKLTNSLLRCVGRNTGLAVLLALALSGAQAVESPLLIPFQGRLTDQNGTAISSGQHTITFNIYRLAVGGTSEWTERHEQVGVINGLINVFLGSIEPLNGVEFNQTLYLGITIDADNNPVTADPEMVPRQMLIPAFHAKSAERSQLMVAGDGTYHGWNALFGEGNPVTGSMSGARLAMDSIPSDRLQGNIPPEFLLGGIPLTKLATRQASSTAAARNMALGAGFSLGPWTPTQTSVDLDPPEVITFDENEDHSITLTTTGGPVMIGLSNGSTDLRGRTSDRITFNVEIVDQTDSVVARWLINKPVMPGDPRRLLISAMKDIIVPAAGEHTWTCRLVFGRNLTVNTFTGRLFAIEL